MKFSLFFCCRYEYRVEMIHQQGSDTSKNIVREFGIYDFYFIRITVNQMTNFFRNSEMFNLTYSMRVFCNFNTY